MKPAEDYVIESMERDLERLFKWSIAAIVVLFAVGAFAWAYDK